MKFIVLYLFSGCFFFLTSCGVQRKPIGPPEIIELEDIDTLRRKHNDSLYSIGNNSLLRNKFGIWELYVEGDALERGLVMGSLSRELMHRQEIAIMDKIEGMVPAGAYRNFLGKIVAWFNRKMPEHIPEEYKKEIYGISRFALSDYDYFAPAYVRALYLHGAHDIGHALQDLMLVGCTSFAAWDEKTADGQLLLGRNFDFFVNEEFAEDKIATFVNPQQGHKFMMYTWGGMIGVVSGMNEKGLTVTINAGKSGIPLVAKTPVSLVAREILQYAGTTQEAIAIAQKREVFVSEAILIGSAAEREAIVIEVSPGKMGVYEVNNTTELICSNHFQSEAYAGDRRNKATIRDSHTNYRYSRMKELLAGEEKLTPTKAAGILRNTGGMNDRKLGLGNEKAINQLLAHHGILFKPEELKVWISANPYQMGTFVAYDLREAFEKFVKTNIRESVALDNEHIKRDNFIDTREFRNYREFRTLSDEIQEALFNGKTVSREKLILLPALNPHYWKSYYLLGEYYYHQKDYKNAVINYKLALKKEVSTLTNEQLLQKKIKKSYRKL